MAGRIVSAKAWAFSVLVLSTLIAGPPAFAGDEAGEREFELASQLHRDGQYAEAAAGWIAAHDAGYREQTAAYNAACALALAGKTDEAFKWLDHAFENGFDLGNYLEDDDDLASLRGDRRFAALREKANRPESERVLSRYRAMKSPTPEQHDEIGRELLHVGRYEEAARAFEAAAAREDDPATSLYNAACARAQQGQKAAALDLLQRAVELGFADAMHLVQDDDLMNLRREPRYRKLVALAMELDVPGIPGPHNDGSGKLKRDWQAALPRVESAVARHPNLGQAWFNLGLARLVLDQPTQAIAPFEKAIQLGYRESTSMYNAACAYARAGQAEPAFAWLDRAIKSGFDSWGLLRDDADLDNLRTDPRFRKYLELARSREI
jgi:tetratricopeptide (TPR) repeat protein